MICTSITILECLARRAKKKKAEIQCRTRGESPNWLLCRKMRGAGWTEVHAAVFEF